jgi:CubicO group peptidase (beta-lactamase class C family)
MVTWCSKSTIGGFSEHSHHSVNSVTKTITSALIGIALRERLFASIDEPLSGFFPQYEEARRVTLRHLMSVTAGFSQASFDMPRVIGSDDPVEVLLRRPIEHEPGSFWFYDDCAVHLLSILIIPLTGISAAAFALENLFSRLAYGGNPGEPKPNIRTTRTQAGLPRAHSGRPITEVTTWLATVCI